MAEGGVNREDPQKRAEKAKDIDEDELERLAVESILEDARRRKVKVERVGTMGWAKQRNVNKRFLNSVVLQTLSRQTKRKCVHGGSREEERTGERSTARESNSSDSDTRLRKSGSERLQFSRDRDSSSSRQSTTEREEKTEHHRAEEKRRERVHEHTRDNPRYDRDTHNGRHRTTERNYAEERRIGERSRDTKLLPHCDRDTHKGRHRSRERDRHKHSHHVHSHVSSRESRTAV